MHPDSPYKCIILAGDRVIDVLLPEEGKHRLTLAKESDSDDPLSRQEAIKPPGGLSFLEWIFAELGIKSENIYVPEEKDAPEEIHWGLRLLPRDLYNVGSTATQVYRVIERHLHTPQFLPVPIFSPQCKDNKALFDEALTIIANFGHNLMKQEEWCEYEKALRVGDDKPTVRRIFLLARGFPHAIVKGRESLPDERFWRAFAADKQNRHRTLRDTLVITSVDRLRQDGAKISKRISWDETLEHFAHELRHFPPLRRLGEFGHLVVRIGVSGAFYCRTVGTEKRKRREIYLIYDPRAQGGIFRDLVSQGDVFGTRAAYAACIAKALTAGNGSPAEQSRCIQDGICEAIKVSQFLYREAFGNTLAQVRAYPQHLANRLGKYLKENHDRFIHVIKHNPLVTSTNWGILYSNLLCDHTKLENCTLEDRKQRRLLMEIRRFRCAMQIVLSGADTIINLCDRSEWQRRDFVAQLAIEESLLELSLGERMDVETEVANYFGDLASEWRSTFPVDEYDDRTAIRFREYDEAELKEIHSLLKRLKRAEQDYRALQEALGKRSIDKSTFKRAVLNVIDNIKLGSTGEGAGGGPSLTEEDENVITDLRLSGAKTQRTVGRKPEASDVPERIQETIKAKLGDATLFANFFRRISVPFNFPIARYGHLRVVGRKDVEAFNDIRNRILFHVQSGSRKPLSLAVFGPPGSGKSFGVKEIAREYAGSGFQEILCNLSRGESAEYLDTTFVTVGDAIAAGKIPLVFFDEFDSSIPGRPGMSWLKYFLQPMQDGYYQHSDGRISVGRSIFVFAGGTHETYEDFQTKVVTDEDDPQKLRDFVSRLKGFVNIPHLSPCDEAKKSLSALREFVVRSDREEIPYLRRAMLIRSLLQRKQLVRPFHNQPTNGGDYGYGLVDIDLLRALLLVRTYRHGARSIEALLDIASPFYNTIAKASLPNNDQLNMHTDQRDFNLLLKDTLKHGSLSDMLRPRLIIGTWKARPRKKRAKKATRGKVANRK